MMIEVLDLKDNEDGTTFLSFEADGEAISLLLQLGMVTAINRAVAECDCKEDDPSEDWDIEAFEAEMKGE